MNEWLSYIHRMNFLSLSPFLIHNVFSSFQDIRNAVTTKGETLNWLKSRLKILIEVSSENEAQKQGDELAKLSSSFKALVALLSEVYYLLIL